MWQPLRHWRHILAVVLLLGEASVVLLAAFPQVDADYRTRFIARTDCIPAPKAGTYVLGETVRPIARTAAVTARGIFACGWWFQGQGAISRGPAAHLVFSLTDVQGPLQLRLRASGIVGGPLAAQHVELTANGHPLPPLVFDSDSAIEMLVALPQDVTAPGRLDIAFRFPDATSRRSLGLGRQRDQVAIFLEAVTLERVP